VNSSDHVIAPFYREIDLLWRLFGHLPPQQPGEDQQAHVGAGADPRQAEHTAIVHEATLGVNTPLTSPPVPLHQGCSMVL